MRYFKFTLDTPYCGTQAVEYNEFTDDVTEKELEQYGEDAKNEHASGYEYLLTGWDDDYFDTEEERDEALENYYADCSYSYKEVSKEEYEENS